MPRHSLLAICYKRNRTIKQVQYVHLRNTRTEMYAVHVASYPLVIHQLRLDKKMGQTDRRTNGRQTVALHLHLDAASLTNRA